MSALYFAAGSMITAGILIGTLTPYANGTLIIVPGLIALATAVAIENKDKA